MKAPLCADRTTDRHCFESHGLSRSPFLWEPHKGGHRKKGRKKKHTHTHTKTKQLLIIFNEIPNKHVKANECHFKKVKACGMRCVLQAVVTAG